MTLFDRLDRAFYRFVVNQKMKRSIKLIDSGKCPECHKQFKNAHGVALHTVKTSCGLKVN